MGKDRKAGRYKYSIPLPAKAAGAVLLLLFVSAGLVYRVRVIYSPKNLGQAAGTRATFVFLCGITAVYLALKRYVKDESAFLRRILMAAGVIFAFATPPNQAPDEDSHFLRGCEMAAGQWGFDENFVFPDDVNLLVKYFPAAYNNGHPAKERDNVAMRFSDYFKALEKGEKAENGGIIIFQFIPYIPAAAGIAAARLIGFKALGSLYAARIANAAFFCRILYFAMKNAGRYRKIFFALAIMPLSCFIYASCNTDGFLLALMYLMFSCRLKEGKSYKDSFVFSVCFALLFTCKASFAVFFPLILCFEKKDCVKIAGRKAGRVRLTLAVLALTAGVYMGMGLYVKAFSNYGLIPRTMENTSPAGQLAFVLSNPARYAVVFLDTLKNNSFFLFSGGLLGWLDVKLPLINYLTPIVIIFACAESAADFDEGENKNVCLLFLCSVLTYAAVMTGLYLSWTPVSLPQIIGLQMRYFIPAFTGLCALLARLANARYAPAKKAGTFPAWVFFSYALIAAGLMLAEYYLPGKAAVFVA